MAQKRQQEVEGVKKKKKKVGTGPVRRVSAENIENDSASQVVPIPGGRGEKTERSSFPNLSSTRFPFIFTCWPPIVSIATQRRHNKTKAALRARQSRHRSAEQSPSGGRSRRAGPVSGLQFSSLEFSSSHPERGWSERESELAARSEEMGGIGGLGLEKVRRKWKGEA